MSGVKVKSNKKKARSSSSSSKSSSSSSSESRGSKDLENEREFRRLKIEKDIEEIKQRNMFKGFVIEEIVNIGDR